MLHDDPSIVFSYDFYPYEQLPGWAWGVDTFTAGRYWGESQYRDGSSEYGSPMSNTYEHENVDEVDKRYKSDLWVTEDDDMEYENFDKEDSEYLYEEDVYERLPYDAVDRLFPHPARSTTLMDRNDLNTMYRLYLHPYMYHESLPFGICKSMISAYLYYIRKRAMHRLRQLAARRAL
jgi:hypothetical protein